LRAAGYASPDLTTFRANCSAQDWQRELQRSMGSLMTSARVGGDGDICIAAGGFSDNRLRDIVGALQIVPRAVRIVPSASLERFLHYPMRSIGSLNSIELQRAPLNHVQRGVKRAMDVAFSVLALSVLSPLLLLVALLIKLDSRGAILFRQTRLGVRGAPFDIFKFRTMTVAENGDDVKQAQKGDVRVTRVGHWLRRLSIDELPQLLNVVRGEMSLVGPRPHAMAHDRYYSSMIENYEVRQHVKPGMTGWAQVNGLRGPTDAPEAMRKRVEADIWYAKNASIVLDVKIMLLTCVEVFRQRNAH
jgi:exopolysaccharide biosynthesis polyprenyl glycosylphosphotransferase